MKYPLFLCDFDGTLVRSDGTVSEGNRAAIQKYCDMGGAFVVCTGRTVSSIKVRVKDLGLTGAVAAFQGATVFLSQTGEVLKDDAMQLSDVVKSLRFLETKNLHIHAYTLDEFYCNRDDEPLRIYEQVCGIKAKIVEGSFADFVQRENLRVIKLLIMVEQHERLALRDELQAYMGEDFFVTCSSRHFVEIMPKGQDKGGAAKFLAQYYGLPLDRVAAMGDQLNDLPMVEAVGGKFTVMNGEEELKKIARVCAHFERDGVAEALEIAMGD